jgi:lipoprotein-releasing system permease protein
MSYELFIAMRYLRAKRRQAAVSVITAIAVTGIAVGVGALIVAQALITGFRSDVQEKILRGTAHLNLLMTDNSGIENYRELIQKVNRVPGVRAASATIYAPVLLNYRDNQELAILKGFDPGSSRDANEVFSFDVVGDISGMTANREGESVEPDESESDQSLLGIIIGQQLAKKLGAELNDIVTAISATTRLTPLGLQPRARTMRFRIAGIFTSGLHQYDANWAYITLAAAQRLMGNGETAGVIQMKVADIYAIKEVGTQVLGIAGPGFTTTNWQELNAPLFAALQLQHRLVIVFFALLIAIAALNIITTLTMMVIEKQKDIAILRAQGATPPAVRRIFVLQGVIIGVIGAILGLLLGLGLSWLANKYRLVSIPSEIYSVSHITLQVRPFDCLWVMVLAILICLLATLYPSRAAAQVTPIEALRYE